MTEKLSLREEKLANTEHELHKVNQENKSFQEKCKLLVTYPDLVKDQIPVPDEANPVIQKVKLILFRIWASTNNFYTKSKPIKSAWSCLKKKTQNSGLLLASSRPKPPVLLLEHYLPGETFPFLSQAMAGVGEINSKTSKTTITMTMTYWTPLFQAIWEACHKWVSLPAKIGFQIVLILCAQMCPQDSWIILHVLWVPVGVGLELDFFKPTLFLSFCKFIRVIVRKPLNKRVASPMYHSTSHAPNNSVQCVQWNAGRRKNYGHPS